jgi:hypothetical protein
MSELYEELKADEYELISPEDLIPGGEYFDDLKVYFTRALNRFKSNETTKSA